MVLNKELNNGIEQIILNMLSKNIPINQIAEQTGIDEQKIQQIAKMHNN